MSCIGGLFATELPPSLATPSCRHRVHGAGRVAIFVDGCFWHGCPDHHTTSVSNAEYWAAKVMANVERDLDTTQRLEADAWVVVRVWEHESSVEAADRIHQLVVRRKLQG